MKKRVFVPIESYALASPEILLRNVRTDSGLFAEALILFEKIDLNVTTSDNLADILQGFMQSFGSISPFLDLINSGDVRLHYFDFISAPIEKNGILSIWNMQDNVAERSHQSSFQQKILYNSAIEKVIPKARHRTRLYEAITKSVVIDASDKYASAIMAAREASKSNSEIEFMLNAFKDSLPKDKRKLLPENIIVKTVFDEKEKLTRHTYNFDFNRINPLLPNLNLSNHLPALGLVQTHRIICASQQHDCDVYLPTPLSYLVLAKMDSLLDNGRKFKKSAIDLTNKASFPDIRCTFNEGRINWKDVLALRDRATRFQQWFAANGGNPDVALSTYGEEYKASTGIKEYREKIFSIATYVSSGIGAAIGAAAQGPVGAMAGAMAGGLVPFVKELFKASEETGWRPRFFGNWVHEKLMR